MYFRLVCSVLLAGLTLVSVANGGTVGENKELVTKFINAINAKSFDQLPSFVSEDFVRHSQASPGVVVESREQFSQFMRDDLKSFPDAQHLVQQVVAEGDRVAIWGTYSGTFAGAGPKGESSGARIEVDVSAVFRIEGDQIAEMWVLWDNQAVNSQLALSEAGAKR